WTFEELDKFLESPKDYVPGTVMGCGGLKRPDQRANVIAYLRSLSDNPVPLPAAAEAAPPGDSKPAGSGAQPAAAGENKPAAPAGGSARPPGERRGGGGRPPPGRGGKKNPGGPARRCQACRSASACGRR